MVNSPHSCLNTTRFFFIYRYFRKVFNFQIKIKIHANCVFWGDMPLLIYHSVHFTGVYRTLLLYTECFYSEIYKAPLGGDDLFSVASSLALENPSCPSAIASNPATGQIYWTDTNKYHIVRANLDGTGEEIILENVTQSKGGLVVNARAGNIYYTDSGKKTLEVAKLDGSCRKVLIQSQTHEFVGLAIDSMRG